MNLFRTVTAFIVEILTPGGWQPVRRESGHAAMYESRAEAEAVKLQAEHSGKTARVVEGVAERLDGEQ